MTRCLPFQRHWNKPTAAARETSRDIAVVRQTVVLASLAQYVLGVLLCCVSASQSPDAPLHRSRLGAGLDKVVRKLAGDATPCGTLSFAGDDDDAVTDYYFIRRRSIVYIMALSSDAPANDSAANAQDLFDVCCVFEAKHTPAELETAAPGTLNDSLEATLAEIPVRFAR